MRFKLILFFSFLSSVLFCQEPVHIVKLNLNDLAPQSGKSNGGHYNRVIVIIDKSTDLKNVEYIKDNSLLNLDLRLNAFPDEFDFKKLRRLRELNIQSEMLNDLSALKDLDSLESIHIQAPKMGNIDFLKKLPALKEAEIFSDSLKTIPKLSNSRIESLTLSVGSSTALNNLRSFTSLKEIKFLKGGLKSIPDYFSGNLEIITIEDQPLLKDIHNISAYKKLRHLSVSNSGLETISGDFSGLQMENVTLSENKSLKDLDALFTIPKINGYLTLSYLFALGTIDLSGKCFDYNGIRINYCITLQDFKGYSECTRIKHLDLSANGLRKFPENLSVIPNLEILNVYETNVNTLNAIKELKSLKELNFTVSATEIPESFYTNPDIEILRIYGTKISDMSGLSHLKKLKVLNISSADELVKVPGMEFLLGIGGLNIYGNHKLDIKKINRNGTNIISNNKNE